MKKILWLSQHKPEGKQIAELKRLFGDVDVRQDVSSWRNAEDILQRFRSGGYAEMVAVVPLSVLQRLCELGLRPLWSQMDQVQKRVEADLEYRGRFYRFVRFRRVVAVEMVFEDL